MSPTKISLMNTDLRDGRQAPGYSMRNPEDPKSIEWILNHAKLLDGAGYDVIEAGFPVGSAEEVRIIQEVSRNTNKAVIAAMAFMKQNSSTKPFASLDAAFESIAELIPENRARITMLISTAPRLREASLRMDKEDIMRHAREGLRYVFEGFLKRGGMPNLQCYIEGASQTEEDFLVQVNKALVEEGLKFCDEKQIHAEDIKLVASQPDTCGVAMLGEYGRMMRMLMEQIPEFGDGTFALSAHCHNDMNLAVPNSLEAIMAGTKQVEVTTLGIGERCGNADASSIIAAIEERMKSRFIHSIDISRLHEAALHLSAITGHHIQPNQPIHGSNANRTGAGIHQAAIGRNRTAYNATDVRRYGNHTDDVALTAMSGKNTVISVLKQHGVKVSEAMLAGLVSELKSTETGELSPVQFISKYLANPRIAAALEAEDREKQGLTIPKGHFKYEGGDTQSVEFQLSQHNGEEHCSELIQGVSENGVVDAALKGFESWLHSKGKLHADEHLELSNYEESVEQKGGSDSPVVVSLDISIKNASGTICMCKGFGVSTDHNKAPAKAIVNAWNRMAISV